MAPYIYRNGLARADAQSPWHYLFRFNGTKYQGSTHLMKREDAARWLRRFRDQLANNEVGLADPPTVQLAYKGWVATRTGKASPSHLKRAKQAFEQHILPTVGQLRCDQLSTSVVENLTSIYLAGHGHTQSGANIILAYLKCVIRPLVKDGLLRRMPFDVRMLKPQEKVRPYVRESQTKAFLAEIDRKKNTHVMVAVRMMLYLGLREDEALSMRWAWIGGDIETISTGKAKGKKARLLPIHPELREMIRQLPSDTVFLLPAEPIKGKDGIVRIGPHRPGFTTKAIKRAGAKIGVEGLSPHRLRNTAATLMARAGVPTTTIQRQLGHQDIKTTQMYVQVGLDDLVDAMNKTWKTV